MIFAPGKLYSFKRNNGIYDHFGCHSYDIRSNAVSTEMYDIKTTGTFMYLLENISMYNTFHIIHFIEADIITMLPDWYLDKPQFTIERL
jgi:hypothetical protein